MAGLLLSDHCERASMGAHGICYMTQVVSSTAYAGIQFQMVSLRHADLSHMSSNLPSLSQLQYPLINPKKSTWCAALEI